MVSPCDTVMVTGTPDLSAELASGGASERSAEIVTGELAKPWVAPLYRRSQDSRVPENSDEVDDGAYVADPA